MITMDMIGEQFGLWTVVGHTKIYRAKKNRTACLVRCECGAEAIREPDRLRSGRTKSCTDCIDRSRQGTHTNHFRLPPQVAAINNRYGQYRRSANKKGYEFRIDRDTFETLILDDCYYCGAKPSTRLKSDWDEVYANGIDRVDSDLGYTPNNVVTACWVCNSAKKSMTQKDFYDWVERVHAKIKTLSKQSMASPQVGS